VKYTVNNVPPCGAFMPVLSAVVSPKASTNGLVHIVGQPGTQAIPSPKPAALPNGPLMRSAQPSYNSPDVFNPAIYYTRIQDMGPPVRWVSTNEVPVPAKIVILKPGVAYRPARFGGLRQVSWPPAPQVWQNINQGAVSG
jgi:hypothetical protein